MSSTIERLFEPKVSAVLAALVYGSWAYYAQAQPGTLLAVRAGAVQACFAFISTLFLASFALLLLQRLNSRKLTLICCSIALVLIPLSLHVVNGTAQILNAMLPGLLIGHIYLISLIVLRR